MRVKLKSNIFIQILPNWPVSSWFPGTNLIVWIADELVFESRTTSAFSKSISHIAVVRNVL